MGSKDRGKRDSCKYCGALILSASSSEWFVWECGTKRKYTGFGSNSVVIERSDFCLSKTEGK